MPNQSHGSALWREPAGSGAVPTVVPAYFVNALVSMAFEWNWGDPLPPSLVFTGDANRTKLDAAGLVHMVAANVPRNDGYVYDRNGLLVPGWLLEGASTNLCLQSANLASGSWFKVGTGSSTFTAPTTTAPDGTSRAVGQFRVTTPADTVGQNATISGATAGRNYTASIWMRLTPGGAGGGSVRLRVAEFGGASGQTQTEVVIQPTATWQRFSVTRTFVQNDRTGVQINMLGNVALSDIQVWGGQIEQLGFASSYIPTTTGAVTRAAESWIVPWPFAPAAMTAYLKGINLGTAQDAGSMRLLTVGGGGNPCLIIQSAGSNQLKGVILNSAAVSAGPTSPQAIALGDAFEVRLAYAADGTSTCGVSDLGGAEQTGAGGAVPIIDGGWSSPSNLYLNAAPSSAQGYVAYQSIRLALNAWSMDQMRKVAVDPTSVTISLTGPERYAAYDVAQDGNYTLLDLTQVYLVSNGAGGYQPSTSGPALAILVDDGAGGITVSTNLALTPIADLYYDTGGNLWVVRRVCNRLHAVRFGNGNVQLY